MNRVKILLASLFMLIIVQANADESEPEVLVEGSGVVLTDRELESEISYLLTKQAPLGKPNLKTMERISGEMLTNKQLLKEAEALGLENDPDVQREIERVRARALIQARLDQFNTHGLTESQQVILAKEYWHTHQDEFKTKARRGLSHILIGLRGRSEEEASVIADDVYKQLKESPEKFEALVEEFSDDPGSKKSKGSLGIAESERFIPEFSKVAFAMKEVGEISEPVKTRFGYHLIRLDKIEDEKLLSYDEVKDTAMEKALAAYVENKKQQHINNLQASSNRKIYPERIKRIWEKMFDIDE